MGENRERYAIRDDVEEQHAPNPNPFPIEIRFEFSRHPQYTAVPH